MGSPYQLILLNLIHIQAVLLGTARMLVFFRRFAPWRPALLGWQTEQEKQLLVLLVLFKQIGGDFGFLHKAMLILAEYVGRMGGTLLACLPLSMIKLVFSQANNTLISGLERAGHQIAIADWAEWQMQSSINPPKALLELADARREWPSRWAGPVQFL